MHKYVTFFLFLLVFIGLSTAYQQSTSIPDVNFEGGETFDPNSDEMGSIEEIELFFRHDDDNTPWNSEIEVEGESFEVVDEERINSDEGRLLAEAESPIELFEGDIDVFVDSEDQLLLTSIVLIGDRRFQSVTPAEETDTGIAETLDPNLEVVVDHPEDQFMDFTFYDIEEESELGETYTFTTCGVEGRIGPSQEDCDSEYEGDSLEDSVNIVDSGYQEWTVPFDGKYNITAAGARGGGDDGGDGAVIQSEQYLNEGDTLRILVGQVGDAFSDTFTSGGGGTFISTTEGNNYTMADGTTHEPLLVAGGGAGATDPGHDQDGSLDEDGNSAYSSSGCGDAGSPGESCGGGTVGGGGFDVAGGGGLCEGGGEDEPYDEEEGGWSFNTGGKGGDGDSEGGWGGGGASTEVSCDRAGGGGGYSGGAASRGGSGGGNAAGGGGGSFVHDDGNLIDAEASNTGQGIVEIEIEGSPDQVIGTDSNIESGELAELEWSDRENFEDYSWTVEACETGNENCVLSTSIWDFTVEISDPDIDLSFEPDNDQHAFDAVAEIEFGRDSGEYNEECYFNITNGNEEYNHIDGDFETTGTRTAVCEKKIYPESNDDKFDPDDEYNGLFEGFEVWDDIEVDVNVTDHGIGSNNLTRTNPIRNQDPVASLNTPNDGGLALDEDVELSIQVNNPEGDDVDVELRDRNAEETLHSDSYSSGSTVDTIWEDLDLGTYEWDIVLEDPYNRTTSQLLEFHRVVSRSYRPSTGVEHEYSSLVVSEGESDFMFFEITNQQSTRDFTTYLEGDGVETDFVETDESSKSYEVEQGETERFHVRVTGENPGEHELRIITEDDNLKVNTTETFPIFIQSRETESHGIPGLTLYYIGLIYLLAASYFWFSA